MRKRWVLAFGFLACAGMLPLTFIAGPLRGIPLYWRFIDASFGVLGALVLWRSWAAMRELETRKCDRAEGRLTAAD